MTNKVELPQKQIIEDAQDEKDLEAKLKMNNIEENKAMEKIFSGSCCHSGIHAYTLREKSE